MKTQLDEKQMLAILNELYDKVLDGIPMVSQSVDEMASDYLSRYDSVDKAAQELVNYQIIKCGTSGFITGLGGVITLPVTIPANVGTVLYVQLRMIAALALMGGFDLRSDQVQTMIYACLTGQALTDIVKQTGIKVGQKITLNAIKNIPGKVLISINQKVGFRLVTKFGETGVVNIAKLVPLAGGVVGGAFDIGSTRIIAANAYYIFIKKEMPDGKLIQKVINDDFNSFKDNLLEGIDNLNNGLGQVTQAAQGLQRTILPNVKLPDVKGGVKIPGVNVPGVNDLFDLPGIKAADIKAPKIGGLDLKLPNIKVSGIQFPAKNVTIETGRLLLRPWKSDDAGECFKYASDPEIGPNAGWKVHTNIEDSMHIIDTVLSAPETYAVVLKETGLPIGSVGIKRGKDSAAVTNSKEAEVGCWIGKTYWNNGYATEAVMALIGRCFNNLRCNGIWYCYFAGNERSKRVAEKAGFKYHHTIDNMEVPLTGEKKTTYFMFLKKG